MTAQRTADKTSRITPEFKFDKIGLVVFGLIFGFIGSYVLLQSEALPTNLFQTSRITKPALAVSPATKIVRKGEVITFSVTMYSFDEPINAVQSNLAYNPSKFQFLIIDGSDSPFNIQAQAENKSGTIKIARGYIGSLSGRKLIAKVKFRAIERGTALLNFTDGSAIVSSTQNTNVLQQTSGSTIIIR